jgi:hypothetical protein
MTRRNLTIPECRGRLTVIANHLADTGRREAARLIREVINHMYRRKAVRMTKPRSPPLTPALKARIRELAKTTDQSQMQIGHRVGVNSGRVSETLAGKRR